MVYKCCVPGCVTGYDSVTNAEKVTVYGFPKEPDVRRKWVNAIPRKEWKLTSNHRVCAKHFTSDDFEDVSSDTNSTRKCSRSSFKLHRLRLKPGATPHIFPNLPSYLSKDSSVTRTASTSASERLALQNAATEKENLNLLLQEKFDTFASFKHKINNEILPSGFISVSGEASMQFHYVKCGNDFKQAPRLLCSVIITENLEVAAYVSSALVPHSHYHHLLNSNVLQSTTKLTNILALCKSMLDEETDDSVSLKNSVSLAVSLLESISLAESIDDNFDEKVVSLLKFIIQQLKLIGIKKNGRRYSADMLTTSFLWQLNSTSLYKKLRNTFILPSISLLRNLSAANNVESGVLDLRYLKQRTDHLTDRERKVVLMIDEVYTAQRIEYSNGSFIGLTEDGLPAKTVLTFMIQSISGKYKDVVCLVPINRIDTSTIHYWFEKVMQALDEVLLVIAICTDNHVCNRKFFTDLCGGKLTSSVDHPVRHGEKLFILFDFAHNFKNIFNNFINKQMMHPPSIGHEHILGGSCIAKFSHIKHLYAMEESNVLKVAFKLKKVSLNPSSIARTSPQHALSIFCESTARALEYYASSQPAFKETARFVDFISNIWKIMSVKAPYKDCRKRDVMYMPIQHTNDDDHPGLKYLNEAIQILDEWHKSGNAGLTHETFTACKQTMVALPKLAFYLINNHGFTYVLSGKLMSDPIEGRFGWYRQANGANFFMSVKQVLLAEKKIRCLSLLQQNALVAASTISPTFTENLTIDDGQHKWLTEILLKASLDNFSLSEGSVAYYVSGYIGRSVARIRKCTYCADLLISSKEAPDIVDCIPSEYKAVLDMANRGGLSVPTEFCFSVVLLATQYYAAVSSDEAVMQRLFSMINQRNTFTKAMSDATNLSDTASYLLDIKCLHGHANFDIIVQHTFNCFAKNELKRLNSQPCAGDPPAKVLRKIKKLTSKSTSS